KKRNNSNLLPRSTSAPDASLQIRVPAAGSPLGVSILNAEHIRVSTQQYMTVNEAGQQHSATRVNYIGSRPGVPFRILLIAYPDYAVIFDGYRLRPRALCIHGVDAGVADNDVSDRSARRMPFLTSEENSDKYREEVDYLGYYRVLAHVSNDRVQISSLPSTLPIVPSSPL